MKEKIYTIPLNDAFDTTCDCPLCALEVMLEQNALDSALGAAMMEPDRRMESNTKGFCSKHMGDLLAAPNKLGLALVLETRFDWIRGGLNHYIAEAEALSGQLKGLFKKQPDAQKLAKDLAANLESINTSCMICEKIHAQTAKFMDVLFYLWQKELEFKHKIQDANGFCMPHYKVLLDGAVTYLKGESLTEFVQMLIQKQEDSLKTAQENLHHFTLKFDYRNADMDWKDAKDAPARGMQRLCGCNRIGHEQD